MAIAPIGDAESGLSARAKINESIVEANKIIADLLVLRDGTLAMTGDLDGGANNLTNFDTAFLNNGVSINEAAPGSVICAKQTANAQVTLNATSGTSFNGVVWQNNGVADGGSVYNASSDRYELYTGDFGGAPQMIVDNVGNQTQNGNITSTGTVASSGGDSDDWDSAFDDLTSTSTTVTDSASVTINCNSNFEQKFDWDSNFSTTALAITNIVDGASFRILPLMIGSVATYTYTITSSGLTVYVNGEAVSGSGILVIVNATIDDRYSVVGSRSGSDLFIIATNKF